jgi:hypothetical protein
MAGRPATSNSAPTPSLRLEVLKELQSLIDDREVRDRLDKSPIGETKGREHWVLHLLLRAQESNQSHFDALINSAYSNLQTRLQTIEDRVQRLEGANQTLAEDVKQGIGALETSVADRVSREMATGFETASARLVANLGENLDAKWKPVGESVEAFAQSSHQLTKDLSDTFRVSTQSRLLLNENARRIIDLGRDIVALEESLKLALTKTLEEGLQPLEERIAALESRLGEAEENAASDPPDPPPSDG